MKQTRIVILLALLLNCCATAALVQNADTSFTLALPVHDDGTQALATLETVAVDMGGRLTREKGSPSEVDAVWDESTLVQGVLKPKIGHTTSAVWELALTCANGAGGAQALCQEVEQRYLAQYR